MAILRSRQDGEIIAKLSGSFDKLGDIVFSSAAKTNHTTSVAFNDTGDALAGKVLALQADQDFYLLTVANQSSTDVTSATGMKILANERVEIAMSSAHGYLSVLRVSADGTLKVWEMK